MRKRLDGIGKLSVEQKRERDARATKWMNNRKIERVAEAAFRHGWYSWPAQFTHDMEERGLADINDDGELIFMVPVATPNDKLAGIYRVERYDAETGNYIVRKIETFRSDHG